MLNHRPASFSVALLISIPFSGGCSDQDVLAPLSAEANSASLASSDPIAAEGCARFAVDVSDRGRVTVEEVEATDCGVVRPVLDGTAEFDSLQMVVRIPLAIENGGADPLEDPAFVRSSSNEWEVIEGSDSLPQDALVFMNPDSTDTGVTDGEELLHYFWDYDDRLPTWNGSPFLEPAERSEVGWIEIAVAPAVESFTVAFQAHATIPAVDVPAEIPDSIPDSIYDDEHVESSSDLMSGTFLRNIVAVMFAQEATQSDRETAIRLIRGEVVGGIRYEDGSGEYYVRIEDDGTAAPLLEALDRLNEMSEVEGAGPEFIFLADEMMSYARPDDGGDWASWALQPEATGGRLNWGLEAVGAPHAWGCSVGTTDLRVAVVDHGFHPDVPDIQQNAVSRSGSFEWPQNVQHGTQVASVLAAKGSNGVGMTGMMWNAGLELWDLGLHRLGMPTRNSEGEFVVRTADVVQVLSRAVRGGAPVVNLSAALDWREILEKRQEKSLGLPQDSARVERFDLRLRINMHLALLGRALLTPQGPPLLVIAGGNYGADAYWAGYPNLVRHFPDWVVVVGAADRTAPGDGDFGGMFTRRSLSNWGTLIDLYAPGGAVGALNSDGTQEPVSGTSFAAPFVSGVAGLLLSFDPRLRARDLKDLIVIGAASGSRSVRNGPFLDAWARDVLNAHESLKIAAEEAGAPLCGNRVWSEVGQIYAERRSGPEALGSPEPEFAPFGVGPIHGGKFIRYETVQGVKALRWRLDGNTSLWEPSGLPAGYARGGTDASVHGFSHDQDTLAIFNSSVVNGTNWWHSLEQEEAVVEGHEVVYDDFGNPTLVNPWDIGRLSVEHDLQPVRSLCIEKFESGGCTISIAENRFWIFRLGYPQNGPAAYLTVSPLEVIPTDSTEWQPCTFDEGRHCRQVRMDQEHRGTRVYRMAVPNGEAEPVDHLPDGGSVYWIGQGEAEPALVLGRGEWKTHTWYDAEHFRATGNLVRVREGHIETCAIEYRDPSGFTLRHQIATGNACNMQNLDYPNGAGGGTIAPYRLGGTQPFTSEGTASGTFSIQAQIVGFDGAELKRRERPRSSPHWP